MWKHGQRKSKRVHRPRRKAVKHDARDAYMVWLLAEHDVAGRPLGGSTDSQTPPYPSYAAQARAPRRENDKLVPLWYECAGLVQACC